MVGDGAVVPPHRVGATKDVHDKLRKLKKPVSQLAGPFQLDRVVPEQRRVVMSHHGAARSRRHDDRSFAVEDVEEPGSNRPCVGPVPAVVCRLTAAGLLFRNVDLHPEAFQDIDHALGNLRIELIDEAGRKQRNALWLCFWRRGFRHEGQTIRTDGLCNMAIGDR